MTEETWTAEDLAEIEAMRVRAGVRVMATALKVEGFPTIHEIAKLGTTHHMGFGYFETVGPNWKLMWNAGGAMARTASGKAYTPVFLEGLGDPFREQRDESRRTD